MSYHQSAKSRLATRVPAKLVNHSGRGEESAVLPQIAVFLFPHDSFTTIEFFVLASLWACYDSCFPFS
jgi:hypothetical protein